MLQLNVDKLKQRIHHCSDFQTAGQLVSVQGVISARLHATVGELCEIYLSKQEKLLTEVIGFDDECCQLMPFRPVHGLKAGLPVVALGRKQTVPVGRGMLGRVIDAEGSPLDGLGRLKAQAWIPYMATTPNPMARPPIHERIWTGQKAIDGLLTIGRGQRIGLFAGSGVGKSTLLGEIAKNSSEDINVVALVGERGRELRPFLEQALGEQGLARSIIVVATIDQPALVRIRAAQTALAIASWFRDQGTNVMLMLDSLTRLVAAQRELGLLLNEPPTSRGYPPSSFHLMSSLVEQMGVTENGAITALLTVLVDGDDVNEPVSDAARSVLDGHVVLSRELAQKNHFPAIDIGGSISRVAWDIIDESHRRAAGAIRQILATYQEVEDLIRIGSYQTGTSAMVDQAIQLKPIIDAFLRQQPNQPFPFENSVHELNRIAEHWYQVAGVA